MLLHNWYINVALAVILGQQRSLYDLQEPKYKNSIYSKTPIYRGFWGQAKTRGK